MKETWMILCTGIACLLFMQCSTNPIPGEYSGKPYSDSIYNGGIPALPGRIQCECYDFGGEGIAFHDTDTVNSGSGSLNPADGSFLHEFRMHEPVDISYTKSNNTDNNPYNLVDPVMDQLYVGWTKVGEWTNYTVRVKHTGLYQVGLMYTANGDGKISIFVNQKDLTGSIEIPTTHVDADTVAWRQWHHWNYLGSLAKIELHEGINLIGLHTIENGNMNFDYLDFNLLPQ
jgi:hypothetical protein